MSNKLTSNHHRRHEGDPYRVWATGPAGESTTRTVADGAAVRRMVAMGWSVDKVERVKSAPQSTLPGTGRAE